MKREPAIDPKDICDSLRGDYGVAPKSVDFVPIGFVAAGYVVTCDDDRRYFLKLWPDSSAGQASIARLPESLALTRALYDRALYPGVAYPISTRDGKLSTVIAAMPGALFPFFAGESPPEFALGSSSFRDQLARTVATIHRATPALRDVLPPADRFDLTIERDVWRGLAAVEKIERQEGTGRELLRGMILDHREDIIQQLTRLHTFRERAEASAGPLVLCHTDLGSDNLIVGPDGQLAVLDWDTAAVASPEWDLCCSVGVGFARFVEVYRDAGGAGPLSTDRFGFFLLRRYVEDMTARMIAIIDDNPTEVDARDLLDGMREWGFDRWANLDRTLDDIASVLG